MITPIDAVRCYPSPKLRGLLLALALAATVLGTARAALAGRIVYLAEQEAVFRTELYLVDTDIPGSTLRLNAPLSDYAFGVSRFAVSPDGGRVLFTADQDVAEDTDLYLLDITAPGTWTRVGALPAEHQELAAKFSPDGRKVAFTASDANFGNVQLYLADLSAPSQAIRLNGELVEYGSVSMTGFDFTADGSRVVYVASERDRLFELYVVDVGRPGQTTRLNGPGGSTGDSYEGRFSILPDGASVVYSAVGQHPGVRELHLVDLDEPQPVTLNAPLPPDGDIAGFTVSPDGRWVAYVADQETDDKLEVYLVDLALPGIATRISGPVQSVAGLPAFTNDSRFVIYSGDEERGPGERDLYRVSVAQPADRMRVNVPPPDGTDVWRYALSADSARLAYAPAPAGGFMRDLMVVDLAAPGTDVQVNGPLPDGSLDYSAPLFGPDGDGIAFLATESLDEGVTELFLARVSVPGTSVRLNAPLPPGAAVASQPGAFAWLPADAPPTGAAPAPARPPAGGPDGSGGGGGPLTPLDLLALAVWVVMPKNQRHKRKRRAPRNTALSLRFQEQSTLAG